MQDFSQLLRRLSDAGLDFVIVGGYATVSHGSSYITRAVDICAVLTDENVAKIRQALGLESHAPHDAAKKICSRPRDYPRSRRNADWDNSFFLEPRRPRCDSDRSEVAAAPENAARPVKGGRLGLPLERGRFWFRGLNLTRNSRRWGWSRHVGMLRACAAVPFRVVRR